MLFKIKWVLKQFMDLKGFAKNKSILKSPCKFYLGIFLLAIPQFYKKTIFFDLLNGYSIKIKDFMAIYIYKEIFIDKCYDNFSIINSRPVVIDIGANIGLFMLWMKSKYPDSRVFCFEPYQPNFDTLQDNIDKNRIENVISFQKAVFNIPGKKKLFIHPKNSGGHSLFEELAGNEYIEVETTTIESFFSEYEIDMCDLLKLDCEGSEYPIIKSFTEETTKKIKNIIFEPTESMYSVEELIHILESQGYTVRCIQGLIIATKE